MKKDQRTQDNDIKRTISFSSYDGEECFERYQTYDDDNLISSSTSLKRKNNDTSYLRGEIEGDNDGIIMMRRRSRNSLVSFDSPKSLRSNNKEEDNNDDFESQLNDSFDLSVLSKITQNDTSPLELSARGFPMIHLARKIDSMGGISFCSSTDEGQAGEDNSDDDSSSIIKGLSLIQNEDEDVTTFRSSSFLDSFFDQVRQVEQSLMKKCRVLDACMAG